MNVSVLIVFLSFFVLGTILTVAITNYWSAEKLNVLDVRARNIANYTRTKLSVNEPLDENYRATYTLNDLAEIEAFLNYCAGEVNGDVAITQTNGVVAISVNAKDSVNRVPTFGQRFEDESQEESDNGDSKQNSGSGDQKNKDDNKNGNNDSKNNQNSQNNDKPPEAPEPLPEDDSAAAPRDSIPKNAIIPQDVINTAITDGRYFARTTLDGIYQTEKYVAAYPIKYFSNNEIFGVVIVSTDTSDVSIFTDMVLKIFILSAIAALGVSVLAIGIFSYNLVKPLKQMAQAARQFAKGDFSVRVSETSNDEIGALAVSFNNMAESLSSAEVTRRSFIANVSHELKTPMTTIAGFIDGILDGTIPPEKNSYYLQIVSEEIKRLSRLVKSMLDLSRLDNGELRLNYKTFDLVNTLVTILISFEQEIDKKNIEIRGLDQLTPKKISGDKDLIHQIVYNLIENAIKFTDDGGYIEFDITENNSRTDFLIKNSGTGIKKTEIPLVFDKFYKTDKSRSKDKKGLGLGLYLVRSIIRLHGGEITADSVYGEYTEFRFYIPKKHDKNP